MPMRETLGVGPSRGGILGMLRALSHISLTAPDRAAVRALGVGAWDMRTLTAHVLAIASGYVPDYCRAGVLMYREPGGVLSKATYGVWPFSDVLEAGQSTGGRRCMGEIAGGRDTATAEDCYTLEVTGLTDGSRRAELYRRLGRGNRWQKVWVYRDTKG